MELWTSSLHLLVGRTWTAVSFSLRRRRRTHTSRRRLYKLLKTAISSFIMEKVKRAVDDMNWEACQQIGKLAFGATLVTILVFINNDVHQLVKCIMESPIDRTTFAPPPINCTSREIGQGIRLRVDVCEPPVIAIYINDAILRSYSGPNATAFNGWLHQCYTTNYPKACPIQITPKCPHYIAFGDDAALCYHNHQFAYLVIGGFQFSKRESVDLIAFITET